MKAIYLGIVEKARKGSYKLKKKLRLKLRKTI
jgi:hypothetical protein